MVWEKCCRFCLLTRSITVSVSSCAAGDLIRVSSFRSSSTMTIIFSGLYITVPNHSWPEMRYTFIVIRSVANILYWCYYGLCTKATISAHNATDKTPMYLWIASSGLGMWLDVGVSYLRTHIEKLPLNSSQVLLASFKQINTESWSKIFEQDSQSYINAFCCHHNFLQLATCFTYKYIFGVRWP